MSCLTFPHANIRLEKAKLGLVALGGEGVLNKLEFVEELNSVADRCLVGRNLWEQE